MRLAMHTDYTLRVLIYLALVGDRKATIDEIADAYEISRNHLMKVVHNLARSGRVVTTRGRSGGIRLAAAPGEVNVGSVVRECEGGTPIVACFDADKSCRITPACTLRTALGEAREAFYSVLDGYTLADLTQARLSLSRLLDLSPSN